MSPPEFPSGTSEPISPFAKLSLSNYSLVAVFGVAVLMLTGCAPRVEQVTYVSVHGMTIPKKCIPFVIYQGTDVQITLPSGGVTGATVSLGKLGLDPKTLQQATGTLQLLDHGRMQFCEMKREAANANDRVTYDRVRRLELKNATKIYQFAEIAIRQPTSKQTKMTETPKKPAAEPTAGAKKPAERTTTTGTSKQKPSGTQKVASKEKAIANVNKWLNVYAPKKIGSAKPAGAELQASPSQEEHVMVTGSRINLPPATKTNVLRAPAKPNSYFGLPSDPE